MTPPQTNANVSGANRSRSLIDGLAEFYYSFDKRIIRRIFADDLLNEIISSRSFQRLKHVAFLGAIDHLFHPNSKFSWRRHRRFDHSVGVGALAALYCDLKKIGQAERHVIVTAALLHDIGHGALSHTLENVFCKSFNIDHHIACRGIIFGLSGYPSDIRSILDRYNISPKGIVSLMEGRTNSEHRSLFAGPLNVDTLEAISRSLTYINPNQVNAPPSIILRSIVENPHESIKRFDAFWRAKQQVYSYVIQNRLVLFVEISMQRYMQENIGKFSKNDFFLTDRQFLHKHEPLERFLRDMRRFLRDASAVGVSVGSDSKLKITSARRIFEIIESEAVRRPRDLFLRYIQRREPVVAMPSLRLPSINKMSRRPKEIDNDLLVRKNKRLRKHLQRD